MSRSTCPTPTLVGTQMMNFNNQTTNQIDNSPRARLSTCSAKKLRKQSNARSQIASGMNWSNNYDLPDSDWPKQAATFMSADPIQVPEGPHPLNEFNLSQTDNSGLWGTGLGEPNTSNSYVNISEELSASGESASFSGYAYFGSRRSAPVEIGNQTNKRSQQSDRAPVQVGLAATVARFPKEYAPVPMDPIIRNDLSPRRPIEEHDAEPCDDRNRSVAILPGDFPTELWTRHQLKAVKKSITDLVQRQADSSVNANSFQYIFRKGWLCVKGQTLHAANWLMAMDTRLRPWEGASLKVVPESQVPLNRTFTGHFPALHSTSVKYTLRLIDILNEGLAAYDWLVLQRDQSGPTMKLTLSIDAQAAEVLKRRRYQLNFGFSQVKLLPSQINF